MSALGHKFASIAAASPPDATSSPPTASPSSSSPAYACGYALAKNYTSRLRRRGQVAVCSLPLLIRGQAMGLHWFRRPKVSVRVLGPDIIVTMPGTGFSVIYTKTEDNKLIANGFANRRPENEKRQISFPHFLALAWTAANEKAKEIGWIS
jgi:hypothetical protein